MLSFYGFLKPSERVLLFCVHTEEAENAEAVMFYLPSHQIV
jgi:hypothetical protein